MNDSDVFFLGRQPIVNGRKALVAYELLFRSGAANRADVVDDVAASAAVIQYAFSDLGVQTALGDKRGFINISEHLLLSDVIELLPPNQVVLELLETVPATDAVVERCRRLRRAGYRLALDDVTQMTPDVARLRPLANFIKIDVMATPADGLRRLVNELDFKQGQLVAEKVETAEMFERCRALGFSLFQGYFFAKATILSGRTLSPSVITLLKLFSLTAGDPDIAELEDTLKQAPDVMMRLLRLAKSAAFRTAAKITSVRQAIMVLGRINLNRMVQIMLFARFSGGGMGHNPMLQMAVLRGRIMEGVAELLGWERAHERAFLVGMLSLFEALLEQPFAEILPNLNVDDGVVAALSERSGQLGMLLRLAEANESQDAVETAAAIALLGCSAAQFNRVQVAALRWASEL